jgi:hypothetical protein
MSFVAARLQHHQHHERVRRRAGRGLTEIVMRKRLLFPDCHILEVNRMECLIMLHHGLINQRDMVESQYPQLGLNGCGSAFLGPLLHKFALQSTL